MSSGRLDRHPAQFNPYFVAYCRAIGQPPELASKDLRGHDFIIWISERWREWDGLKHGGRHQGYRPDEEYEEFGAWLDSLEYPKERTA